MKRFIILILIFTSFLQSQQQIESTIVLNRGKLWHSFNFSQEVEPMNDWRRLNYGLDWPGYNEKELDVAIGGYNSYLVSGGFFLTAKTDSGTTWGWDNFATNGLSAVGISGDNNRYLVKRHEKKKNHWLLNNPSQAEETIYTEFEFNGAWFQPWDNQNIPVNVKRVVRQWSGSKADQDYVIIEYTFTNVLRRDPLEGVYLLFTYALSPNHRGWNLTYPNLTDGARNIESQWNADEKLLTYYAGDFKDSPGVDDSYDYYLRQRYNAFTDKFDDIPEWVAPGHAGIKFLYISPDTFGVENRINGFNWSVASSSGDFSGPFLGIAGIDAKYESMANPLLLSEAFTDPQDSRMGRSRTFANFSLGPFNIPRRDSIKIILAQFVGGIDYEKALDPATTKEQIKAAGDSAVIYLNSRIEFNYQNNFKVPVPPPGPTFSIKASLSPGEVANIISFGTEAELALDPHQMITDLAGYRIYKSNNFPFGPWVKIAEIQKGDTDYFNPDSNLYSFTDSDVALGYDYYYAVTSFDTGHDSWNVDPAVSVPPLESSLYANRTLEPFQTTLLPSQRSLNQVTVVPNPFYRVSGLSREGVEDRIQFVNVSEKCSIRIFTVRGNLVKTIRHNNPESGVATWNQINDNGQLVKSGLYFFHVENEFGEVKTGKFAIVK